MGDIMEINRQPSAKKWTKSIPSTHWHLSKYSIGKMGCGALWYSDCRLTIM